MKDLQIVGLVILILGMLLFLFILVLKRYGYHTLGAIVDHEYKRKPGRRDYYTYPVVLYKNQEGIMKQECADNSVQPIYFRKDGFVKIIIWQGKVYTRGPLVLILASGLSIVGMALLVL